MQVLIVDTHSWSICNRWLMESISATDWVILNLTSWLLCTFHNGSELPSTELIPIYLTPRTKIDNSSHLHFLHMPNLNLHMNWYWNWTKSLGVHELRKMGHNWTRSWLTQPCVCIYPVNRSIILPLHGSQTATTRFELLTKFIWHLIQKVKIPASYFLA